MSYAASVRFVLEDKLPPLVSVLHALSEHGWILGAHEGPISVQWVAKQQDGTSRLESECFPADQRAPALDLVVRLEAQGQTPFVLMHWTEDWTQVELHRSLENKEIYISLPRGGHEILGFEPFKDVTWYLTRLLPAIQTLGLIEIVQWVESP